MDKKSINLIIQHDTDPVILKKLKLILPLTAVASLTVFVVTFFLILIYTSNNITQFNHLKKQISEEEQKISNNKNTEGIYILSSTLLSVLNQILTNKMNFSLLLDEILDMETDGINISSSVTNRKRGVELTLTASSSGSLSDLVSKLLSEESAKKISDIRASGIIRNKKGQYLINVSFTADKSLFL